MIRAAALGFSWVVAMSSCSEPEPAPVTFADKDFPAAEVTLVDVTTAAGLPTEGFACLVFDDLDGDQRPDLLVGRRTLDNPAPPAVEIYRNQGDGTFELVPLPIDTESAALCCAAADVDNDGVMDLAIGHTPVGLTLLRGLGGLAFEDISSAAPSVVPDIGYAFGVSALGFFDMNRDGWLDLFVGLATPGSNIECESTPDDFVCTAAPVYMSNPLLFVNDGSASFTSTDLSGDETTHAINAVGIIDWDGDGFDDLFVSNDFAANHLLRNVGGTGAFEDLAPGLGIDRYNHAMGTAFGDFDRDGRWDIYVTDLGPDQFYFGGSGGTLRDRAAEVGITNWTQFHSGWSPLAADFNQDGHLDLFVQNSALVFSEQDLQSIGHGKQVANPGLQADFLFVSDQNGAFDLQIVEQRPESTPFITGGSSAMADFDGDGDLDVAEYHSKPATFRLLRNDTQGKGHWLVVNIEGSTGGGIGSRVDLYIGGHRYARAFLSAATGSVGKSWRGLHFGLGAHESVDAIVIRWPDGAVQTLDGPHDVDRAMTIRRP